MRKRKGYSLVEMLVCVMIAGIGFLAASQIFDTLFSLRADRAEMVSVDISQQTAVLTGALRNGKVKAINSNGFTLTTSYFSGSNEDVVIQYDDTNKNLLVGENVLLSGIDSVAFKYYDFARAETTAVDKIKAVRIELEQVVNQKTGKKEQRRIEAAVKV